MGTTLKRSTELNSKTNQNVKGANIEKQNNLSPRIDFTLDGKRAFIGYIVSIYRDCLLMRSTYKFDNDTEISMSLDGGPFHKINRKAKVFLTDSQDYLVKFIY